MDKDIDIPMNIFWFVLHVGVIGFGISYLIDRFMGGLDFYMWFLAPLGALTRFMFTSEGWITKKEMKE